MNFEHLIDEVVQVELETGSKHAGVVVSADGSYLNLHDGTRNWFMLKMEIVNITPIRPERFYIVPGS